MKQLITALTVILGMTYYSNCFGTYFVTMKDGDIRSGPRTDAQIVGKVKKGEIFDIGSFGVYWKDDWLVIGEEVLEVGGKKQKVQKHIHKSLGEIAYNSYELKRVLARSKAEVVSRGEYDFRKTKWGMSREQVIASESRQPVKREENFIGYQTVVLGKDVYLMYIFVQNKLVRAKYVLAEKHTNKTRFISDYQDFKKILVEKYGEPRDDDVTWLDDMYKDDPSNWGMAIATGRLAYISSWNTTSSDITCFLYGDNFDITCGVEYQSIELENLEDKEKRKKAMEAF